MAISKAEPLGREVMEGVQVFEKEILNIRKERFTIANKEAEIAQLQARIVEIQKDIDEAKAIKEE